MENSKKNNNQKEQREKRDLFSVRLFSVEKSNKLQKYDGTYCEFSRGTITTICERKHKTQKGRRVDKCVVSRQLPKIRVCFVKISIMLLELLSFHLMHLIFSSQIRTQ